MVALTTDAQLMKILKGSSDEPAFIGAVTERDHRESEQRQRIDRRIAIFGAVCAFIAAVTGVAALVK
jgi:hypothetical protein